MKEYMKVGNLFELGVRFPASASDLQVVVATHAINVHDELVSEVERLRGIISQIKNPTNDDCMKFLCCALRHYDYEIKGNFEVGDMKPAFVLYANSKGA